MRFSFRHEPNNIATVIEGPEAWVKHFVEQIGLGLDCGWMMEMSQQGQKSKDETTLEESPLLPGPPPDPSKIPAVIREIGSFDPSENLESNKPPPLDEEELRSFISEMPEPEIPPDSISNDPLTEEWLRLVLAIVVTEHGISSMMPETIASILSERTSLDDIAVSIALKRLWVAGKVDKILTERGEEYSPSPSWIQVYRE
ncbi:MAG TPA: hypothetical protein D7H98_01000 [Candidatus Poseidoniales archaeon]|nr:MAG TPA: hypothetical protein D7H98_01000 [Candidatus Poseidoniales archaeon]